MKKSYSLLFLIFVFVIAILFSIYFIKMQQNVQSPESTLVKCFNSSGAKVVNAEMYFWGEIEDIKYNDFDNLVKLSRDIMYEIKGESQEDVLVNTVRNDYIQEVNLSTAMKNNTTISVVSQIRNDGTDELERFISIRILKELSNDDMETTRDRVIAAMDRYGIAAHVNSCITGSFEGKLTDRQMNDVSKAIFKGAEARKVEGIRERNLISVSAYSPVIDDYIKVDDKKVNLNLAIRYNAFEDRTYIWLATPVISKEY